MRKTELWFGVGAGITGLILAGLSWALVLPYATETVDLSAGTIKTYAIVCMAANAVGLLGAVLVQKHHILGSVLMAAATVVILLFGFPWQAIPAVTFIVSFVMALAPVSETAR